MNNLILNGFVKYEILKAQLLDEQGQDLIEYALVAGLIGFACIVGMNALSSRINLAFSTIGSKVGSALIVIGAVAVHPILFV